MAQCYNRRATRGRQGAAQRRPASPPRRGRGHAAVVAPQAAQAATTSLPLTCGPCSGASRLSGNRRRRAPLVSRQPRSGALARSALWPLRLRLCRSRNEAEPAAPGAADQAATSVARGQPRPVPRSVAQPSPDGPATAAARAATRGGCDPRSHLGRQAPARLAAGPLRRLRRLVTAVAATSPSTSETATPARSSRR